MLANDPLLWLSFSAALLAVSLAAIVVVAVPVLLKLSKTAQSADRLLETLNRELPAALDALRSTGEELSDLTEDVGDGVESAKAIVQRVDQGMVYAGRQLQRAQITSKSAIAGIRTAWSTFRISDRSSRAQRSQKKDEAESRITQSQASSAEHRAIAPSRDDSSESMNLAQGSGAGKDKSRPDARDSDAHDSDVVTSQKENTQKEKQVEPMSQE